MMQIFEKIRKRRNLSGLLLVLYVSCMVVAYTHQHESCGQRTVVCTDCANHVQHHSHLSDLVGMHDTCVLCQTLVMPVILLPFLSFVCLQRMQTPFTADYLPQHSKSYLANQSLRGPPVAC